MTQVGILIEKYQFGKCLHFASNTWIGNLDYATFPNSFSSELMEWIFIAWVFNMETTFQAGTRIAISTAAHVIKESDVMGLPIPSSIIKRMNKQREESIRSMYDKFCRFLNRYKGTQQTHDHNLNGARSPKEQVFCKHKSASCDLYYLGCLFQLAMRQNAYPPPLPPYNNQSLESTKLSLRIQHDSTKLHKHIHLKCGEETEQLLQSKLTWGEVGLSLGDFKQK